MRLYFLPHISKCQLGGSGIENTQCDTIKRKKFDRMVKSYYKIMTRSEEVSIQQMIDIVKIYISIPVTKYPEGKKIYLQYIDFVSSPKIRPFELELTMD